VNHSVLFDSSSELLAGLLTGEIPADASLIDALLRRKLSEDVHLEYKAGPFLERIPGNLKPPDKLRKYVSAFANADGGILIVGVVNDEAADVDHSAWTVWGVGEERDANWASKVCDLQMQLPLFCKQVDHRDGRVLVIACRRSPTILSVVVKSRACQFFRIGDSTLQIDPYLYADLVLGRRKRPRLTLALSDRQPPVAQGYDRDPSAATLRIGFTCRNEGLSWPDEPWVGIVAGSGGPLGSKLVEVNFAQGVCGQA
jgi:hypothetical protein